MMEAYIIYNESDRWWTGLLKPGFSHVVLVLITEHNFIICDPKSSGVDVKIRGRVSTDAIETALTSQNTAIQRVSIKDHTPVPAPVGFFTCVEFVKRVLGIHAMRIQTPYQLFNYIQGGNYGH